MSFILQDFSEELITEKFITDNFAKSPQELLAYINKPKSYAENYNGFGFKYNLHEANILHDRILNNDQRLDDGLDIIHHDYDDTAIYDDEPSDIGLSASQRNGRL